MSSYLIKVIEYYRCDTEAEAVNLIKEAKNSSQYSVIKTSSEVKTTKVKGEITDEYRRVTITKGFTSEKDPDVQIMPNYEENE